MPLVQKGPNTRSTTTELKHLKAEEEAMEVKEQNKRGVPKQEHDVISASASLRSEFWAFIE
jgi:hypothetical protein